MCRGLNGVDICGLWVVVGADNIPPNPNVSLLPINNVHRWIDVVYSENGTYKLHDD
jgi:hypothetical protein